MQSMNMASSSSPVDGLAIATGFVVASQVGFLITAYLHAILAGQLAPDTFHISAVLDDDKRSVACAALGAFGLCAMVLQELYREQPHRALRTCLAAACGIGIILVCVVRESTSVNGHRATAALTFGTAVALVWVVSTLSRDPRCLRWAARLVGLVVFTGCAQGANIMHQIAYETQCLPSWALGMLELALLMGFTLCICTVSRGVPRCRSPAELEKAELASFAPKGTSDGGSDAISKSAPLLRPRSAVSVIS